ncbi:TPA: hypothetical protein PL548_001410 [Clostridium botulinum]|nr:hypothetical protein [Clostridium botulinum]
MKGDGIIKLSEIIINFLISIAASAAFYVYIENLKKTKNVNQSNKKYSSEYISKIKKQFYICFIPTSIIVIYDLYISATKAHGFITTFKLVLIFWLLVLSLFSFMCSMEIVNSFTDKISENDTTERNNDIQK